MTSHSTRSKPGTDLGSAASVCGSVWDSLKHGICMSSLRIWPRVYATTPPGGCADSRIIGAGSVINPPREPLFQLPGDEIPVRAECQWPHRCGIVGAGTGLYCIPWLEARRDLDAQRQLG